MTIEYGTRVDAPIVAGNDDHDDIASAIGSQIRGNFQKFETITERDAWTSKYKTRLFKTTALVKSNEDGEPQWFEWSGTKTAGTDGAWVILETEPVDTEDGLIPFEVMGNPQSSGKAHGVMLEPPLTGYPDPDTSNFRVGLKHGLYELANTPNYLAYSDYDVEVVGKKGSKTKHRDGALWFNTVMCPAGAYINLDKPNKRFGIQEPDDKDPNVTGGTNYLIAVRIALKGKAPNDGKVRLYLLDNAQYGQPVNYLKDINGNLMAVERQYKQGDKLGYLEVVGIVNAKGLKYFSVHASDDLVDDFLNISGSNGDVSGIMIQALTDKGHTSDALRQYEIDTKQRIRFKSEYMGAYRFGLDWFLGQDMPMSRGEAGQGMTSIDGLHFYNTQPMKIGIQNSALVTQDDGTDMCYFSFGKIFNSEETVALHNRDVKVTAVISNPDCASAIYLMKWTGKPDEYTDKIITGIVNMQPTLEKGWAIAGTKFVIENPVDNFQTVTVDFNVPEDANNYAIIYAPQDSQSPCIMKINKLQVDVKKPFTAGLVYTPDTISQLPVYILNKTKKLVQDNQGYASLRYTLDAVELPMPCGKISFDSGDADITIDATKNVVNGSAARGGEGAIKFNAEGVATINTEVYVWPGEALSKNEEEEVNLWFCRLSDKGELSEIDASTITTKVVGGGIPVTASNKFTIQVQSGDEIVFRGQASKRDGAFLESTTASKPMVKNEITFEEVL